MSVLKNVPELIQYDKKRLSIGRCHGKSKQNIYLLGFTKRTQVSPKRTNGPVSSRSEYKGILTFNTHITEVPPSAPG